jgi:hypothetical protein
LTGGCGTRLNMLMFIYTLRARKDWVNHLRKSPIPAPAAQISRP